MIDIEFILRDLIEKRDLQQWINNRFKDPHRRIIDGATLSAIHELTLNDGIRVPLSTFPPNTNINVIGEVYGQYDHTDLRPTDRALDIGANIGLWTLHAAKVGCQVTAIEPLYYPEMEQNLLYNGLSANVIKCAIGTGGPLRIEYNSRESVVPTKTLTEILELSGPVDFLKIDCEGGEWCIQPEELEGIRRIEAELHDLPGQVPQPEWSLIDWIKDNYTTRIDECLKNKTWLLHAYEKAES